MLQVRTVWGERLPATAALELVAAPGLPFALAQIPKTMGVTAVVLFLLLAGSTLVSEDLTCIAAGVMVAQGRVSFLLAACACVVGIFGGDMLLFFLGRVLGRPALKRAPLKWFLRDRDVALSSTWFASQGFKVIMASRFLPGTRLPAYFAAGLLRTSFWKFALYFFLAAVVWTPALVGLSAGLGSGVIDSGLLQGRDLALKLGVTGVVLYLTLRLLLSMVSHRGRRLLVSSWRRITRWEFWPLWAFYAPVVCYIVWLAVKHRSLTLFTAVNPAMPASGFIGESKSEILQGLSGAGDCIARFSVLEDSENVSVRFSKAKAFMEQNGLSYPVVLKPDVGQRGCGVAVVRSDAELEGYLRNAHVACHQGRSEYDQEQKDSLSRFWGDGRPKVKSLEDFTRSRGPGEGAMANREEFFTPRCGTSKDENGVPPLDKGGLQGGFERRNKPTPSLRDRCRCATAWSLLKTPPARHPSQGGDFQRVARKFPNAAIIQEYVPGAEFGVFYYRYPNASHGRIFSITEKRFPHVTGNGKTSLERLILDDPRAVCMARFYLNQLASRLWSVPGLGESVQLVELGTHCRGAVFLDGSWVKTDALEAAIDRISKRYDGFYFGRYDIRTPSVEDFKQGRNFKVVELNGVTSEATHIYDPKNSLLEVYRVLFAQWRIAFEIGSQNRQRSTSPTSLSMLASLILEFKRRPKFQWS